MHPRSPEEPSLLDRSSIQSGNETMADSFKLQPVAALCQLGVRAGLVIF